MDGWALHLGRQSHLDVLMDWRREMGAVRGHESGRRSERRGTVVPFQEMGTQEEESHWGDTPGFSSKQTLPGFTDEFYTSEARRCIQGDSPLVHGTREGLSWTLLKSTELRARNFDKPL